MEFRSFVLSGLMDCCRKMGGVCYFKSAEKAKYSDQDIITLRLQ